MVSQIAQKIQNQCDTLNSSDIRAYQYRHTQELALAPKSGCRCPLEIVTPCVARTERPNTSVSAFRWALAPVGHVEMFYFWLKIRRPGKNVSPIAIVRDRTDSAMKMEEN